MLEVLYYQVC